mgnify:FL=1
MQPFWLVRDEDVSGTSGTGMVAEGVMFSNGWCSMHWLSKYTSVAYYQSVAELEAIHGHNGKTRVVWQYPKLKFEGVNASWAYGLANCGGCKELVHDYWFIDDKPIGRCCLQHVREDSQPKQ